MKTHQTALDFLNARKSVPISQFREPGPSDDEIHAMLTTAVRVPDHGRLEPWRFILFRGDARNQAGMIVADRLETLEGPLTEALRDKELTRFNRAPLVIGIVSNPKEHPRIPEWEQFLSGGSVATVLIMAAEAMGYGANWVTNWFSSDADACLKLGLKPHERMIGFVHIGSFDKAIPDRPRPDVASLISEFDGVSEA